MITKAFRKLSKEDREEAKSIMSDLVKNDGMSQDDAASEALTIMLTEAMDGRDDLLTRMQRGK